MKKILVWDIPVRLFHWLLMLSLFAAWYTSDGERGLIEWHLRIGYFILAIVIFRVLWGFIGTTYARFSQFVPNLQSIMRYVKGEKTFYVGHNPLGALMVFAMIVLVLSQAISGLFMTDDIFTNGPYYDSASKDVQQLMAIIHHWSFDLIVVLSVIHIAAVLYYHIVKKEFLIKAMILGYKIINPENKDKDEHEINKGHSHLFLAIISAIAVAGFVYWLVFINPPVAEEYYY
ncbi:cytochrome b/b6 domain-containing protein [Thalassotalea ganghwensis]